MTGFHGHVRSCHAKKDRDMTSSLCKNVWDEAGRPRRLLQIGARMVLGRSGAEWREAPMQDGTVGGWASRGQEGTGLSVSHVQLL